MHTYVHHATQWRACHRVACQREQPHATACNGTQQHATADAHPPTHQFNGLVEAVLTAVGYINRLDDGLLQTGVEGRVVLQLLLEVGSTRAHDARLHASDSRHNTYKHTSRQKAWLSRSSPTHVHARSHTHAHTHPQHITSTARVPHWAGSWSCQSAAVGQSPRPFGCSFCASPGAGERIEGRTDHHDRAFSAGPR